MTGWEGRTASPGRPWEVMVAEVVATETTGDQRGAPAAATGDARLVQVRSSGCSSARRSVLCSARRPSGSSSGSWRRSSLRRDGQLPGYRGDARDHGRRRLAADDRRRVRPSGAMTGATAMLVAIGQGAPGSRSPGGAALARLRADHRLVQRHDRRQTACSFIVTLSSFFMLIGAKLSFSRCSSARSRWLAWTRPTA